MPWNFRTKKEQVSRFPLRSSHGNLAMAGMKLYQDQPRFTDKTVRLQGYRPLAEPG